MITDTTYNISAQIKSTHTKKDKAIPVTGREDWEGCETSRVPYLLGNRLRDSSEFVILSTGRPSPPGRFLVLISVRRWVDPGAIVRLERLIEKKKNNHPIGTRTRDIPACSIMPQPTTLPRASSRTQEHVNVYIHSPIRLYNVMLN
jgi:hypothetical protein